MNRNYPPTSTPVRAACVAVALTITIAVATFINTLAGSYGPQVLQATAASATRVAQA